MVLVLKPKWNKNQIYTTRSNSLIYLQSLLNLCFTAFSSKLKKRKEAMDTYRHGNNACSMTTPLSAMAEAFEELIEISKANQKGSEEEMRLDTFCDACSFVSVLFGCLGLAFKFAELEYVSKVASLL